MASKKNVPSATTIALIMANEINIRLQDMKEEYSKINDQHQEAVKVWREFASKHLQGASDAYKQGVVCLGKNLPTLAFIVTENDNTYFGSEKDVLKGQGLYIKAMELQDRMNEINESKPSILQCAWMWEISPTSDTIKLKSAVIHAEACMGGDFTSLQASIKLAVVAMFAPKAKKASK